MSDPCRIRWRVSGPARSERLLCTEIASGALVSHEPGDVDDPTFELSLSEAELAALVAGKRVDASYMQGRTKLIGPTGAFLDVLDVLVGAAWRVAAAAASSSD